MEWERYVKLITFEELTPRRYLPQWKDEILYEKALLNAEERDAGEYSRNTATWD